MSTEEKIPDPEVAKPAEAQPPPPTGPPDAAGLLTADVVLRGLLFASTLIALLLMVTSKQTVEVALSVACLYSIVTALASISVVLKPVFSASFLLFFVLWDVVMLGLVASATGTAGGVAYIGLKGNSHVRWNKVCNVYDKFCQHIAASIAISLLAAFVLILLIVLSIFSLHKKIPK